MSTKQIYRFSIFQSSKVLAFMVFFFAALFAVPAGIYFMYMGEEGGGLMFFVPFLYLVGCFIFYAVFFWFYNFVAGKFGGIEMNFKDEEEKG